MHALIILQFLSVLGTLSATVPMKRGNGLKPRHSKALEGRSAIAFHFKRQTIPPTKATKVSALPQTIVKRTSSVKKSTPARARLPSPAVRKSLARKTLRASPKAFKNKVCRRTDNAQTGASCSTTVDTLTGGTATPPPEPSCNEIESCVECIQHKCNYAVAGRDKPRCVSNEEDWGQIKAKSSLHCEFFRQLLRVTARHASLITNTIKTHIFKSDPKAKDIFGSHLDTVFQDYLLGENLIYSTRVRTENGVFTYTGLKHPKGVFRKHTRKPFYSTWDSKEMYKRYDIVKMCEIAVTYTLDGSVVIPSSFNGELLCITIVTKPGSTSGTCFPWAKAISHDTAPGTPC